MLDQKSIHILCQSVKLVFVLAQVFEKALNEIKYLGWLKKFGPAKNILGPVKGQGMSFLEPI